VLDQATEYLGRVLRTAIVDAEAMAALSGHDVVNARRGATDFYRPTSDLMTLTAARAAVRARADTVKSATPAARDAFQELVLPLLAPNAVYNLKETARRAAARRDEVEEIIGWVEKDERILDSHERITAEQVRKIESMQIYWRQEVGGGLGGSILAALGRMGAIALLIIAFLIYLRFQQPSIYHDMRSLALLTTLGVLALITTQLVVDHFGRSELLIPIALVPLLAAILLNRGVALFLAFMGPVLLVGLKGFGADFLVASSAAGVAVVLASENIKRRHELYLPVLVIALVNLVAVLTLGLAWREPFSTIADKGGNGMVNAGLAGMVVIVLLPFFEKVFRITTDFTLIELLDRNHPLLKRMAMEAPGTFHHSMLVSELAREAAGEVGGNPLLAQVGAYYHDIGKMQMPEYFIENQSGRNRHDNLTPTMSCLILGAHVRDGIQMAREAGLPREIIAFIPEHHGTNLMSYFYHKAQERDSGLEDQDFRYPGPRPGRKETAIVMLADSVEATARSLEDPNPGRIRSVVKQIIDKRAEDGQLDSAALTLADLVKVRETFIAVLDRFFHGRIQYPDSALKSRRQENGGRPPSGLQGEESPLKTGNGRGDGKHAGRRVAASGIPLANGTESVVPGQEEGNDAHPGGGPAAAPRRVEERAPDDRAESAGGA
jgi:putative nucleotidyltransferase with HDIG domain